MRVLVDTNVILDLLLNRMPFAPSATKVVALIEESELKGYLCATTVTTLDYLLSRSLPKKESRNAVRRLMGLFEIAPVNRSVLDQALESSVTDFEDAVLEQSALLMSVDCIISRNLKDFKKSMVRALDPSELLSTLKT